MYSRQWIDARPRAAGRRRLAAFIAIALLVAGCSHDTTAPTGDTETCTGYPDWRSSPYVLPYPVGSTYRVIQGNCAAPGNGHRGVNRYSYDFDLPIGTTFIAARAGTVVEVEQRHFDGEIAATGLDNYVVVLHDDGTAALYGHLTHDGAVVSVGQRVVQGEPLGRSGNTGNTGNIPHLHFSVQACDPVVLGSAACPTVSATFRNTTANPNGLVEGVGYRAGGN